MEKASRIDPVSVVEAVMYDMFHKVFHNCAVREFLKFRQISQSSSTGGLPGWYLWFTGKKGAYHVEMTGGDVYLAHGKNDVEADNDCDAECRFVIRYFPGIEEGCFDDFSWYERILSASCHFDETGTPTLEGRQMMHESYFTVGYLDVRLDTKKTFLELRCSAPERWRDYRVDGLDLVTPEGEQFEAVVPGGQDRNVPGWSLSSFVFDKIVSGICFSQDMLPLSVLAAAKAAVVHRIDGENNIQREGDSVLKEYVVAVTLGDKLLSDGDSPCNVLRVRKDAASKGYHFVGSWNSRGNVPSEWANPEWWNIRARDFQEEPGHLCSCYEDH